MTKFKKGDKVVCVDADHSGEELTVGEKYTVTDCGQYLVDLVGILGSFNNERFILSEKSDEIISDLQNQLETWKRIHATDQECIRSLMAKSMDFSQHVILPVEEFRRLQNQILDETKYSTHMVANYKQLQKELDQQIEEKLSLMDEMTKMRADECCLSSDEEDEIDQIVKEINDER